MSDLLAFALYVLPTNILLWLVFWFLSRGRAPTRATRAVQAARTFANRRWGEYHRFVSGMQWESGEHELYRTEVLDVSVYGWTGMPVLKLEQPASSQIIDSWFAIQREASSRYP